MFLIESEKALFETFRPLDREAVPLPKGIAFPYLVRDYLSWVEPSRSRVFLIFAEPESRKALGVDFRRDQSGGRAVAMCDWCHAHGSTDEIRLLTAEAHASSRSGSSKACHAFRGRAFSSSSSCVLILSPPA